MRPFLFLLIFFHPIVEKKDFRFELRLHWIIFYYYSAALLFVLFLQKKKKKKKVTQWKRKSPPFFGIDLAETAMEIGFKEMIAPCVVHMMAYRFQIRVCYWGLEF